MMHYQLRCEAGHEFDAWFRDSAAYHEQRQGELLECPHCGERRVALALMAPALPRRDTRAPNPEPVTPASEPSDQPPAPNARPTPPVAPPPAESLPVGPLPVGPLPDQVRAVLQRLRAEVERRCEYVAGAFAAEARRIHEGQSEPRGIYGEATPEEAEALVEDGIEVSRIPWLPRADA
jgi:hypothetical protein